MPSLGPTSAAETKTRLADLGLYGHLHITGGGAFCRERWLLGRQPALEHRSYSKAGDTHLLLMRTATLEREIARGRYGDPGGERGDGTRRIFNSFGIFR